MTNRSLLVSALSATVLLSACGKVPSAAMPMPGGGGYTASLPTSAIHHLPPGVNVLSMTLTPASVSVAVGATQQFTPTIALSNGQTVYDPQLVQWSVGDPYSASINGNGLLTPTTARLTSVRIDLDGKTAQATVSITPAVYSWQQVSSPTTEDLYTGRLISHNEAWVAGAKGTVLHFLGGQWQPYQNGYGGGGIDPNASLRAMAFADPSTGFMVGDTGTVGNGGSADKPGNCEIYAYANSTWVPMPLNVTGQLRGVAVTDRNHAWAVGNDANGNLLILHWNGQSWLRDTSVQGSGHLNAVQMLGDEAWAVGQENGDPVVLHYDGTSWSNDRLPLGTGLLESGDLRSICMINSQQGYAVGVTQPTVGFQGGLMFKYDSRGQNLYTWSNWSRMTAADAKIQYLDQVPLNGVSMLGGGQGWVVGQMINPQVWFPLSPINALYGNLMSFNGTTYTIDNSYFKYNLSQTFNSIDTLPQGDGLVVGSQGYLMQRTYDWQQMGSTPTYQGNGTAAVPGTITGTPATGY